MVFEAMSTQWRTSFKGAIGLDYSVIPVTARMLGVSSKATFQDIRVMEAAALKQFNQAGQES